MFGLFGKREDRLAPVNALFARVAEASRRPACISKAAFPTHSRGASNR
jgi:cytochrome b pre-mRNA-processing protein 3